MYIPEGSSYLLKLIPKYRRVDGEGYILSRMVRITPKGSILEMLFCRRCLSLYVPVVNSRMRCDEDVFSIECNGCCERNVFKVEDIKSHAEAKDSDEAYRFSYYFGHVD